MSAKPTEPIVHNTERGEDTAALSVEIPPELDYFDGHFPEAPVLPGVVQIDWAIRLGTELFGIEGGFGGMEVIKFQRVIRPGQRLELSLTYERAANKLKYQYADSDTRYSAGRILFLPDTE